MDCNTLPTGVHFVLNDSPNAPGSNGGLCVCVAGTNNSSQLFVEVGASTNSYVRSRFNGSWTAWKRLAFA